MSRRRFNLGDILRKINDGNDNPQRVKEEKRDDTPAVLPSEAPQNPLYPSKGRDDSLPRQPLYYRENIQPSDLPTERSEEENNNNVRERIVLDKIDTIDGSGRRKPPHTSDAECYDNATLRKENHSGKPGLHATPQENEDDESAFDIFRYVDIIFRRRYLFASIVIILTAFSFFRYLFSDKYYIARARLLFRPDAHNIFNDQMYFRYWGDREKIFNTHLELLRSNTVLTMVAENLGGKETPEAINASLTIKQGETNGEKNDIIEISCRHNKAETARDIVNELCRSYIEYRRSVNAQEITRLISKFEYQIDKIQKELSAKEAAIREFKESHRMVELSNETNATIAKLADMESSLQQTELALLETRERFSALNSQINAQQQDIVQSVTYQDPFQNRIAALELELNTLASEYSQEHFKVKMLRQQIENLKAATADSMTHEAVSKTLVKNPIRQALLQELVNLSIEKAALEAKRTALQQLIERLNGELARLPAMEQKYAYLQRESESLIQTLRMLKTKYEETKIRRDSEESDLKLLELAQTPTQPISKVNFSIVIIGILVGIILGIVIAVLMEYLDQTVKEPSLIERKIGIPLLGFVPFIKAENVLAENSADLTKNILEPFRTLRANLKLISSTHRVRTFLICSAVKGEGKTTLAANLAITFALDGKRTVLIDADLRRSHIHNLFSIPKQTGLTDYLLGTATLDQIFKSTRFENLSVITSGERPHNPAELLGTMLFDRLIEELKTKADIVIFDSPALLLVSDTITMAPKMECIIYVVRTFWTPARAALQGVNLLRRIGLKIYGGILNGVSYSGVYYPYYYGYYGYYSYKYSYDEDNKHPFSIRKAGLRIESSLKERLTSLNSYLPRLVSDLNRGAGKIAGKKMLWLLLLCLIIVTALQIAVDRYMPAPISASESIIYMGLTGRVEKKTTDKSFKIENTQSKEMEDSGKEGRPQRDTVFHSSIPEMQNR